MNSEQSKDTEAALSRTLESWRVEEPLPPRFADSVWARIAREERRAPAGWFPRWLEGLSRGMLRPALGGTYVAVLLVTGLGGGSWRAQVVNERTTEALSARYVHMLDPYQMPRL